MMAMGGSHGRGALRLEQHRTLPPSLPLSIGDTITPACIIVITVIIIIIVVDKTGCMRVTLVTGLAHTRRLMQATKAAQ